eukprot:Gb_40301 [translate_table: standard]
MRNWRSMVIRIGEKCPEYRDQVDTETHIETCCGILWRELEQSRDDILELLMQCAEELPHKSLFYGTLVGLLNLEDEDFGRNVVHRTHANLQEALNTENCNKIRTLMRFLTALMCSNAILPDALIEVFETLLSSAATIADEERGNHAWKPRADFYISCILACLPWGGLTLAERVPEEFEGLLAGIEAYLGVRKRILQVVVLSFDNRDDEPDVLQDLWGRIKSLAENGWIADSVPRPHIAFEDRLGLGKSHGFGTLTCPEKPARLPSRASDVTMDVTMGRQRHEAELKYPKRIRRFQIFPASKTEYKMQPIDRFVVEEYLLDTLLYLYGCRKECVARMVSLPVPFQYEYLMAETILSQVFLLPKPPFKIIYYTTLMTDLCNALPRAFPAVIVEAVRALFDRIDDLDIECRNRLVLWLSHHLSIFDHFIWPWQEWVSVLDLPKWSPRRVFVTEVLEKEMRLSYWERLEQSVQKFPALEELLPPQARPCFKYSTGENHNGDQYEAELSLSTELSSMARKRKTAREIHSWVMEKIVAAHGQKIAIEVVVQTLLHVGSKSISHLVDVLERYGDIIRKLGSDQSNQILVIEEVAKLWQNSAQMTAVAVDRMMGYRIISYLSIVGWIFSPANIEQFHTSDRPWEILRNAINKSCNRLSDLRKEVKCAEELLQSAIEACTKTQSDLESAETSLAEGTDIKEHGIEISLKLMKLKEAADKFKEEEISTRESLEARDALLARALRENEELFIALYKSFSEVLRNRLPGNPSESEGLKTDHKDAMAVDSEQSWATLDTEEHQQWCLCTLGQVQALSRQYAPEVWAHIEKLDAEVFTGDVHPLFTRAVYSGLRRPFSYGFERLQFHAK